MDGKISIPLDLAPFTVGIGWDPTILKPAIVLGDAFGKIAPLGPQTARCIASMLLCAADEVEKLRESV